MTKQICGGLATALTGDRRCRSILEEIEKRDLFLRRTDAEGSWFQYHHLFADYLLHRLERDAKTASQTCTVELHSGFPNIRCSARRSIT